MKSKNGKVVASVLTQQLRYLKDIAPADWTYRSEEWLFVHFKILDYCNSIHNYSDKCLSELVSASEGCVARALLLKKNL